MTRSRSPFQPPGDAESDGSDDGEAESDGSDDGEAESDGSGDGEAEASSSPSRGVQPGEPGDGEASWSSDPLAGELRSASSWSGSADVELQRDLLARRMFGGAPVTIDRFEVERLVGAGASAAVYAARDPLLDRRVAIKVLRRARGGSVGAATARWIHEARALAHLPHRNVVTIHEVGQWNERPFIAMELIEGTTLARWLAAERRSVAQILACFLEAGRGLAAAHARGHVHRDFKPANVLVAHDGRVVVSDFGLVDDTTRDGEATSEASGGIAAAGAIAAVADSALRPPLIGTPAYVAPEQRAGAAAHPSADVYSFALALVEAVLGYHPMPESSEAWRVALRGRVSRRLDHELGAALVPQPQQRTQSLGPLLDALAMRRNVRARRLAGALAIVSAALFVMVVLWSRHRDPIPPPFLLPPDPPVLPAQIFEGLQALLATPAEARDDAWGERARTWLMLPIPARVPCRWPMAPRAMEFVGDHVVTLDSQGQVTSCEIRTGFMSPVASDVMCLRPVDDTMLGVAFRDRRIAVYQHDVSGWRRVPVDGPTVDAHAGSERETGCVFDVSSQGITPPRIFLHRPSPPPPPQEDSWLAASGGRTVSVKIDGSIYVQSGDTPPALVVPPSARNYRNYRIDEQLNNGVVVTTTHAQIYDLISQSVVAEMPIPGMHRGGIGVDISRDGGTAVVGLDGRLLWWRSGERQWRSQPIAMNGSVAVKLGPLGERVLIRDVTGQLAVRELVSGRSYPLAGGQIRRAQFRDDDLVVAIDEAGVVWRWSLGSQRSSVLADHAGQARMWGFAICDGGRSVVTATNRKDRDILISAPTGAAQATLSVTPGAQIYGLACQGDRILAGTRDGYLLAWDWPTGHPRVALDLGVRAWVWALATARPAGGPRVDLIGMGQVREPGRVGGRVLALRDGALTTVFSARFGNNTGINDIAVSADGRQAAAVASSGELAFIDVAALRVRTVVQGHGGEARRVRFRDGGQTVVTVGDDGYLRTWRVADGAMQAEVQLGHGKIFDLDVHDRMALVGAADGHVEVWDLETQRLIHAYAGHNAWAVTVRFDESGQWVVSGDLDGRACLHRADFEGCYAGLVGHRRDPMAHVTFLDDGQIITASEDGTVRQWNPPYGASNAELACELESHLFDGGAGAATRDCGAGGTRAMVRPPRPR